MLVRLSARAPCGQRARGTRPQKQGKMCRGLARSPFVDRCNHL